MEEIKFRAWWDDGESQMMLSLEELQNLDNDDFCVFNIMTSNEELDNETKFMQYTGLKDKNGKEIYEGDIVRIIDWFAPPEVVEFNKTYAGYLPFVNDGGCGCCSDLSGAKPHEYEVIGNIYENPELLEMCRNPQKMEGLK